MRRFDQMNVIPLVDVMLVLLAIVLTTASFVAQGKIPLTLPEASYAENTSDGVVRVITIAADGRVYLDDEEIVLAALDAELIDLETDTAIRFKIDQDTAFQHFVSVLDLLRKHQ
ncbi:MAG TPA: biopolymer transporter ExbD, partial [Guyparkeria sp.]|nr:biopolymer transporter ExbD [Guyparkeria sp.]